MFVVVSVIVIVGALGFVFWKNFMQSPVAEEKAQTNQTNLPEKTEKFCVNMDDVEQDGKFCSESMGIKFTLPEAFVGKFKKAENYDITKGPMESAEGTPAGKSLEHYEAVVTLGQETPSLSVAKEPSRSGYSSIAHALRRTYFNADTGNLHLVNGPTRHYDSATDTFQTTGSMSEGELVPSFNASGTKIYRGQIGDAGVVENGYLLVANANIVVIRIKHSVNPMENSAINFETSFKELEDNLKNLRIVE